MTASNITPEVFKHISQHAPEYLTQFESEGVEQFFVFVSYNHDSELTEIFKGKSLDRAIEVVNFWDERMDSYLVSTRDLADYFDRLSAAERLDMYCAEALERIDKHHASYAK